MNTAIKLAAIPVATVLAYPRGLRLSTCGRHNHPSGRLALEGRRAPRLAWTSRPRLLERRRLGAVL